MSDHAELANLEKLRLRRGDIFVYGKGKLGCTAAGRGGHGNTAVPPVFHKQVIAGNEERECRLIPRQ